VPQNTALQDATIRLAKGSQRTRRVLAVRRGRTSRPSAGSWNAGLVAPCSV